MRLQRRSTSISKVRRTKRTSTAFTPGVADATGNIEGVDMRVFIMAATYGPDNHVVYLITPEDLIDLNERVMNYILDSFTPLVK